MGRTIAFIGLGNMGRPMALNLAKAGHRLVVHDIDEEKLASWRERGGAVAGSPAIAAEQSWLSICMVETTDQAEDVVAGERGILRGAKPGHIVACMSTIDPLVAVRLAKALATRGIAMVDAPVSGGTSRAASGELSIIVGGTKEAVAACEPAFHAMGRNIFHVGELGLGLVMKLINNMLYQVNTVAIAEALILGVKAGLDPAKIYSVVRVSTGTSFAFETRVPKLLRRDFSPTGTVDMSYKDQELETAFAKQIGAPMLLANLTQQVYQMARAAGYNREDGTAIVKVLEKLAGVQLVPAEEDFDDTHRHPA